jgi:DNA-3-methyladenine glycosylase II
MGKKGDQIFHRFLPIAEELSPALADAMRQVGPLELKRPRGQNFPEYLCRAVAGQQLSTKAASAIWRRVVESAENQPLLDYFHRVDPTKLRACGLSNAKSKTVRAIADAAAEGHLDAKKLKRLDHAERTKQLTAIWGVGQWTADMMGIFYFGDEDIWPDGDLSVRTTLVRLTSKRRSTLRTADRFAPHRSYLALYMWQVMDSSPS